MKKKRISALRGPELSQVLAAGNGYGGAENLLQLFRVVDQAILRHELALFGLSLQMFFQELLLPGGERRSEVLDHSANLPI